MKRWADMERWAEEGMEKVGIKGKDFRESWKITNGNLLNKKKPSQTENGMREHVRLLKLPVTSNVRLL